MKIMILCPKDVTFNFRRELIFALQGRGDNVILVSPYGSVIDIYTEMGCEHVECKIDRRGTNVLNDAKLILDYVKIIRSKMPDIVLTYTTKCSIYGGLACEITKTPYIVNTAGFMQRGSKPSRLEKFILFLYKIAFRKASCMMYQNSYEREIVNKALNNRVHYRSIPGSGVNLEEYGFVPFVDRDEPCRFNFVARVMKSKGIDEFLQCAEQVKKRYPLTEFIIYGDFDDTTYKEKIKDLERSGVVIYAGAKKDIRPYIKKACAVIHPSYYEGMTNVVLEHSAMGRVCIGSNIPGVKEGIDNGITGFLFEVRNVSDLVEKVITFIEMPYEQKVEMGKNARKKMEKEFDRRIITSIYLQEIDNVVGAK